MKMFPTATFGTVFNSPSDWEENIRGYVEGSWHKSAWSGTDIDLRVFYDNYDEVASGAFTYPPLPGTITAYIKARADWMGAEANATHEFGKVRITAGADYEHSMRLLLRNIIVGEGDISHTDERRGLPRFTPKPKSTSVPALSFMPVAALTNTAPSGAR